jgi:hypothetical protein
MTHAQSDWQKLQIEYALCRVVYQLATEAVDRDSHSIDTMTAAFLVEGQARENLAEVRRRMFRFRSLCHRRSSSYKAASLATRERLRRMEWPAVRFGSEARQERI